MVDLQNYPTKINARDTQHPDYCVLYVYSFINFFITLSSDILSELSSDILSELSLFIFLFHITKQIVKYVRKMQCHRNKGTL
jgi:hypothetical protein